MISRDDDHLTLFLLRTLGILLILIGALMVVHAAAPRPSMTQQAESAVLSTEALKEKPRPCRTFCRRSAHSCRRATNALAMR